MTRKMTRMRTRMVTRMMMMMTRMRKMKMTVYNNDGGGKFGGRITQQPTR